MLVYLSSYDPCVEKKNKVETALMRSQRDQSPDHISPFASKTVSPQTPQAVLYIGQETMWNPKSKEQGSQCLPAWIKEN